MVGCLAMWNAPPVGCSKSQHMPGVFANPVNKQNLQKKERSLKVDHQIQRNFNSSIVKDLHLGLTRARIQVRVHLLKAGVM